MKPMVATDCDELRYSTGECRVDLSEGRKIRGHAIVFNTRSLKLGDFDPGFFEVVTPEAVDRSLREAHDIRALVDHLTHQVLGRTTTGTLALRKDRTGLHVVIDPPDTSYARDLLTSIDRGDISGMSFRFRVMPDGDEWEMDSVGNIVRTINDMVIKEVSVVTFPAYPDTDVSVAKRSLDAFRAQQRGTSIEWLRKVHKTRLARS